MYLEKFESFEEKQFSGSDNRSKSQNQNEEEKDSIEDKSRRGSSKYLRDLLELDFERHELFNRSYDDKSNASKFQGLENLKDSQFNHSKIVRHIENDLKQLMLNYNLSKIIQMNLGDKIGLLR